MIAKNDYNLDAISADPIIDEQQELRDQLILLDETQLNERIKDDLNSIFTAMRDASPKYSKEDLYLIAFIYKNLEIFLKDGIKTFFQELNKYEKNDRISVLTETALTLDLIKIRVIRELEIREKVPIEATDSVENLYIKFYEIVNKINLILKSTVEVIRNDESGSSKFWIDLYSKVQINFLINHFFLFKLIYNNLLKEYRL